MEFDDDTILQNSELKIEKKHLDAFAVEYLTTLKPGDKFMLLYVCSPSYAPSPEPYKVNLDTVEIVNIYPNNLETAIFLGAVFVQCKPFGAKNYCCVSIKIGQIGQSLLFPFAIDSDSEYFKYGEDTFGVVCVFPPSLMIPSVEQRLQDLKVATVPDDLVGRSESEIQLAKHFIEEQYIPYRNLSALHGNISRLLRSKLESYTRWDMTQGSYAYLALSYANKISGRIPFQLLKIGEITKVDERLTFKAEVNNKQYKFVFDKGYLDSVNLAMGEVYDGTKKLNERFSFFTIIPEKFVDDVQTLVEEANRCMLRLKPPVRATDEAKKASMDAFRSSFVVLNQRVMRAEDLFIHTLHFEWSFAKDSADYATHLSSFNDPPTVTEPFVHQFQQLNPIKRTKQ